MKKIRIECVDTLNLHLHFLKNSNNDSNMSDKEKQIAALVNGLLPEIFKFSNDLAQKTEDANIENLDKTRSTKTLAEIYTEINNFRKPLQKAASELSWLYAELKEHFKEGSEEYAEVESLIEEYEQIASNHHFKIAFGKT
jgi:vacuolar-type H+-ATPase subunit I/STV1